MACLRATAVLSGRLLTEKETQADRIETPAAASRRTAGCPIILSYANGLPVDCTATRLHGRSNQSYTTGRVTLPRQAFNNSLECPNCFAAESNLASSVSHSLSDHLHIPE